jgi:hypothetical protein
MLLLLLHTCLRRVQFGVLFAALLLLLQSDHSKAQQQVVLRGAAGSMSRVLQAPSSAITSLQLILAPSNRTLLSIQDNQKIYLGDLPGSTFNINALVSGTVKSVRFTYNNSNTNPNSRTRPPMLFAATLARSIRSVGCSAWATTR